MGMKGVDHVVVRVNDLEAAGLLRVVSRTHHQAQVRLLDGASPRAILEKAVTELDEVHRFELEEPSLNEIFISVVGNQKALDANSARSR